jgi:ATP-dependent helicase YprA (DUF1998 family)
MMMQTIGETIQEIHHTLCDYLEATYHISNPGLITQRHRLLEEIGVTHQQPYLESTPRYKTEQSFSQLGLPPAALQAFDAVSTAEGDKPLLIHDPPFHHQAESVLQTLTNERSLIVMTGTGSGKTECFVLPILGKLANEARDHVDSFQQCAVRAIILYPMNALVNDQLGRLRLLFGDSRVRRLFQNWAGRPARFGRYTSRTLYPGVRTVEKDQERLKPLGDYYVRHLEIASGLIDGDREAAQRLVVELQKRGKWPAKSDLVEWYGKTGSRWQNRSGAFQRCITLPDDAELLTRHEIQTAPPDVLVTNYSMLEYMLMRPIERPIFDATRKWLGDNPHQKLLLVVDEAHLYRGAAGSEVALLIRRLRARLGIGSDRLQVICTSASFQSPDYAPKFAAKLTGKSEDEFHKIVGNLKLSDTAAPGNSIEASCLASIDLERFNNALTDEERFRTIEPFLDLRGVVQRADLQAALYEALVDFPAMGYLINKTMQQTCPANTLGSQVFPDSKSRLADQAATVLIALGSIARLRPEEPGLLPCRVHSFYRGLPGLWVCMDPECSGLTEEERGGPTGRLYGQPREACDYCGGRVLELYTCRICGTAYARAYTNDLDEPSFLWSDAGMRFKTETGEVEELKPFDLLLESPSTGADIVPADFDIVTGRLNPVEESNRRRQVHVVKDRSGVRPGAQDDNRSLDPNPGEFKPCGVCLQSAAFGRTSVQDHQTKGDQPFQSLITKQIQVQPPNQVQQTSFAPLRGRKVLVFSDSRQTAARLAPNLQTYSMQDVLRPLIIRGFWHLQNHPAIRTLLSLEDTYLAILLSAAELGVRLRPELRQQESFQLAREVDDAVANGILNSDSELLSLLVEARSQDPPVSLLRGIMRALTDPYYGLESLGLASLTATQPYATKIANELPSVPGTATTVEERLALAKAWVRCWRRYGFRLYNWMSDEIRPHSGKFKALENLIQDRAGRRVFEKNCLPLLIQWFTEPVGASKHRLRGIRLSLDIGGDWVYCKTCRTTQRPFPNRAICLNCGSDGAHVIDPNIDPVFRARKGYYRASTLDALQSPPVPPIALIAAEHTAQLNSAQAKEVFSKAEEHELLFQDVDLGPDEKQRPRTAIDVLSCTTTMEVGIDIGSLSGVALRNAPPARANYQQRAGRAGRRGNAVATVIAFGSADSHDEHYFTHPEEMIRGPVIDPSLTLNNCDIAQRHVLAYLLQRYHGDRMLTLEPNRQNNNLFSVLGTVEDFKKADAPINRDDFAHWMQLELSRLYTEIDDWLPGDLTPQDRQFLLDRLREHALEQIDKCLDLAQAFDESPTPPPDVSDQSEEQAETGEETPTSDPLTEYLLDRLLYRGVLPRYAFPTDVATFHVFDPVNSTRYRPAFTFTPSQGLPVAVSEYAPGREIWVGGRRFTSGALYSPMIRDRARAWEQRKLYFECKLCHYGKTEEQVDAKKGDKLDCPACGEQGSFGEARWWVRPPGFAHPYFIDEGTSPDDQPPKSYATRAKLIAPTPSEAGTWTCVNERLRTHHLRQPLLVTNRGPREQGYTYCTRCGLIEASILADRVVTPGHLKPFPAAVDKTCPGDRVAKGIVLGTDFITDVLLISLRVSAPVRLRPGLLATEVALRTLSDALAQAACQELELDAAELQAEFRPALTLHGQNGLEAEIYLYDTLPGGAGFARQAGELKDRLFDRALQVLTCCPDRCDSSCYRCLRSYKNKLDHFLLDRHIAAALLNYLLKGALPTLDDNRLRGSRDLLYEDLQRQGDPDLTFERDTIINVPGLGACRAPILATRDGRQTVIDLTWPLTPDYPITDDVRELREFSAVPVCLLDELVIRKNLPRATTELLHRI